MSYVHREIFKIKTQNKTSQDAVSVLIDVVPWCPCKGGSPASPGACPIPVLISIQSHVVQEEEDLPPHAISVLLMLLHMKPMELVCNALEFSGNLYLCSMLPLAFRGLLTKGQACRETGRKGEPVASIAIKESLGLLSHPTRQHDTLARGSWAESLGSLVFLAGGSKPRATAVREREELQAAEGAVQLALGKQVSREQPPGLGPWFPILWLEYVILQLLHTLGWLHLPCEGAMQASGRLPHPGSTWKDFPPFPSFLLPLLMWRSGLRH